MKSIYTEVVPYTYLVKCIPTGQVYYGLRWRNKVSPELDLWKKYFTSSKKVKALIKIYGKDAFHYEIRKLHKNADDAFTWERKVLIRMKVLEKDIWLNDNISGIRFRRTTVKDSTKLKISQARRGMKFSDEHIKNMSKSKIGQILWNKGLRNVQNHSDKTKKLISEASKKQIWSEDRKRKISLARKGKPSPLKGTKASKPKSKETIEKLRQVRVGCKWFNNGSKNKIAKESPGPDWREGRLRL
jgi:hypothetical protein